MSCPKLGSGSLETVRKLLIDEDSEWGLNWLNDKLNDQERELLGQLTDKFGQAVAAR